MSRSGQVTLVVSVDAEEDAWAPTRERATVENVRELTRLSAFLHGLGMRATYFVTYQVALQPWAADILGEVRARWGDEVGAHLHPWNTPPLDDPFLPHNTVLKNLPGELQRAKLEHLTALLTQAVGARPRCFRAGRFGLGVETVTALRQCGYTVDSSVTPYYDWQPFDNGPSFVGAPFGPYYLREQGDVRMPAPSGAVVEVPISSAYNRRPFSVWNRLYEWTDSARLRRLRVRGLLSRTGVLKRILLGPERASVAEMLRLSRLLIEEGVEHLHLFLHSSSLLPGLTPYAPSGAAVERLYAAVARYVEALAKMTPLRFGTVPEVAGTLMPVGGAD